MKLLIILLVLLAIGCTKNSKYQVGECLLFDHHGHQIYYKVVAIKKTEYWVNSKVGKGKWPKRVEYMKRKELNKDQYYKKIACDRSFKESQSIKSKRKASPTQK